MGTEAATLRLLTWFSPSFPTGAFGYSHGLETAVREDRVRDAEGLGAWISGLLAFGGGWTDAVLFKAAWSAPGRSFEVAELALALAVSAERRRETVGQGEAFAAAAAAWDLDVAPGPYPVAAGAACGAAGLALGLTLTAYLHAFASNLVSVAVRAVPLGQSDAVRVLASLEPLVLATAQRAAASSLDDLGACALASDICALRHETLDGRLFIS
jgi:urease accessory protein